MNAEIMSIGTELLLGRIIDTDAPHISRKLAEIGIDVYHRHTVGDNPGRLIGLLKTALERSDIVITVGGLGPTIDDVTIETIARFLGKRLVINKTILEDVRAYFRLRRAKCPAGSKRQAYIPEGVKWIRNRVGTAPGLVARYKGKIIVCLPGPPRELEPMFDLDVIPYLAKLHKIKWVLRARTIKTTGLAEAQVNYLVKDLLKRKPPTTVGIYAKLREVDLVIMTKAESRRSADRSIARIESIVRRRLGDNIFGCDDETLEEAVGKVLLKKKKTIAVAESCTGGLVSHRITNVSGSSKYFLMGIVAYSNLIKTFIVGVAPELLTKSGAVSRQVALSMAENARLAGRSDVGVGITGIAGPTGGTKAKPVGLVYIAFADGAKRVVRELRFRGNREEIKFQASQVALDVVRKNV